MSLSKVAVFTTSEIQQLRHPHSYVSTGALERAIRQDYKVYVVTTRTKLNKYDQWWLERFDHLADRDERVYLTTPRGIGRETHASHIRRMNAPWQRLYATLDLAYPTVNRGMGVEPDFWVAARLMLGAWYVRLGFTFKDEWTPMDPERARKRIFRGKND